VEYKEYIKIYKDKISDFISPEDYKEYKDKFKNKIWDFRGEAVKYCNLDHPLREVVNYISLEINKMDNTRTNKFKKEEEKKW